LAGLSFGRPRRLEHRRPGRRQGAALPHIAACRSCGELLSAGSRDPYCESCAPARPVDARAAHRAAGSRVTQARRDSIRRQRLAALEWDRLHPTRPDADEFTRTNPPGHPIGEHQRARAFDGAQPPLLQADPGRQARAAPDALGGVPRCLDARSPSAAHTSPITRSAQHVAPSPDHQRFHRRPLASGAKSAAGRRLGKS
jgi:hypothetical protein